jgi:hypothetical protein
MLMLTWYVLSSRYEISQRRAADVPWRRCWQALRDLLIAVHLFVAVWVNLCGLDHPAKIKRSTT